MEGRSGTGHTKVKIVITKTPRMRPDRVQDRDHVLTLCDSTRGRCRGPGVEGKRKE